MMFECLLKDVLYEDEPIINWPHVVVTNDLRIYYKPAERKGLGGWFYAVEWSGTYYGEPHWGLGTAVECWFYGVFSWDGLRHLYMGDKQTDTENYLYYKDPKDMVKFWQAMDELEDLICAEHRDN